MEQILNSFVTQLGAVALAMLAGWGVAYIVYRELTKIATKYDKLLVQSLETQSALNTTLANINEHLKESAGREQDMIEKMTNLERIVQELAQAGLVTSADIADIKKNIESQELLNKLVKELRRGNE